MSLSIPMFDRANLLFDPLRVSISVEKHPNTSLAKRDHILGITLINQGRSPILFTGNILCTAFQKTATRVIETSEFTYKINVGDKHSVKEFGRFTLDLTNHEYKPSDLIIVDLFNKTTDREDFSSYLSRLRQYLNDQGDRAFHCELVLYHKGIRKYAPLETQDRYLLWAYSFEQHAARYVAPDYRRSN